MTRRGTAGRPRYGSPGPERRGEAVEAWLGLAGHGLAGRGLAVKAWHGQERHVPAWNGGADKVGAGNGARAIL